MTAANPTDPVTTEIIRGALIAATDEMKNNLMRTAYNEVIYEALDFTVGLFDADGDTISIGLGLPMFIRGLSEAVKAKLAHYGTGGMAPGDILLTNDAYITGSHLNHIVLTMPIFHEDELVAFSSTMAHWQDIGGVLGTITQDIYSEGLQLPIVKLFKAGEQDAELTEIIRMNVRFPERALGDLRAQIASIRTGERRVRTLFERYGSETVKATIASLYDHSELLARRAVARIPDGSYNASAYMDDDGITSEPVPIEVEVIVSGDELTVDLSGVSPQVAGYFNSGKTTGLSAAQVAFKCLTTATEFPLNDGAFRPLRVILPPGKVVSALKPAPMHRWMTIPMTVIDTIFRAVATAIPDEVAAAHHADLCSRTLYGQDHRTGRFFVRLVGVIGGGWGAKHNQDGCSGTICINDGDTHNSPVESTEVKLPVRIERYGLRADSGGPGRQRGGLGVEQRVRVLSNSRLSTGVERTKCAPWGLLGGYEGLPNRVRLETADGPRALPNGKLGGQHLAPGEIFIVESGGGGGFGPPWERDPQLVARDVRAGYVSVASARKEYGVELDANGAVDLAATDRLRAAYAAEAPTRDRAEFASTTAGN